MIDNQHRRLVRTVAMVAGAVGLVLAPLTLPSRIGSIGNTAMAAAGGNGGGSSGNGNGGNGNSGNGNSGNGNSSSSNAGGSHGGGSGTNSNGNGAHGVGGPGLANSHSIASALGALNASHASPTALSHAAPNSQVGKIAAYDKAMVAAINMPSATPAQIAARQAAIADARSTQLAAASNKSLTPAVVAQVDKNLGLPAVDPTLGVP
jgi:hypothetical protein